jgi:type III secretion system FlhB-like substrate exporter
MNRPPELEPSSSDEQPLMPLLASTSHAVSLAIIEEAQRRGTEIGEDHELLAQLSSIDGEEQIPREVYGVIAAVLAWVDGLK